LTDTGQATIADRAGIAIFTGADIVRIFAKACGLVTGVVGTDIIIVAVNFGSWLTGTIDATLYPIAQILVVTVSICFTWVAGRVF